MERSQKDRRKRGMVHGGGRGGRREDEGGVKQEEVFRGLEWSDTVGINEGGKNRYKNKKQNKVSLTVILPAVKTVAEMYHYLGVPELS